jgi:thioredoxin-related protein
MNRLIISMGILVVLACFCSCKSGDSYQPVTKFDPARDAARDITAAVNEAGRSGKNVILDVGGDWCIWCRRLDQFFEQNKDVSNYMHENYVVVKVNWSEANKNEAVLSSYPKIPGYPHLFVLDAQGNLLHSQDTGLLESGDHHDRDKIMEFLRQWAPRGQ